MNTFPSISANQSPSNCDKPLIQFMTKGDKSKEISPPNKSQELLEIVKSLAQETRVSLGSPHNTTRIFFKGCCKICTTELSSVATDNNQQGVVFTLMVMSIGQNCKYQKMKIFTP
jgi:hypothetical protein